MGDFHEKKTTRKGGVVVSKIHVMHYINQFFAGIGGEEKADVPVGSYKGPVGPGKRLQELLGDSAEIVVTAYCGDDYFPVHRDEVLASILQIAKDNEVKIVVAGPAFFSGRHGFACVEVCHAINSSLGLDCVTAMYPRNPGVEMYKQYKDRRVFAVPTTENVVGMEEALKKIARFVSKLVAGSAIGPASEEGYISRGIRVLETVSKNGVERAVDMLLSQHYGRPFTTEVPVESLKEIPILPPITNLAEVCLALVTETGLVPLGNPDGFKSHRNTVWKKYSIANLNSMQEGKWEVRHAGWNVSFNTKNPNYAAPLDVCREMEREGVFARLYPYLYSVCGNNGQVSVMQRIGGEMAVDMKAEGVDVALLVAT